MFVDAAAEEGIEAELVDFSDYNLPNPALTAGEPDLNQFPPIIYLAPHNVATGDDLQTIGAGGLGNLALQYGFRQLNPFITWGAVLLMIAIVQFAQALGNMLARRVLRR